MLAFLCVCFYHNSWMKYSIIYDQVFLICLPIYYLFSHMFSSRSHICLQQDEEMFCWNKNVWGSKHENPQCHLVITSARLIKSNISVKYWKSYKWWLRNLYFFTNISNYLLIYVCLSLIFFWRELDIDVDHILLITFSSFMMSLCSCDIKL